jgi:hypothetical protein
MHASPVEKAATVKGDHDAFYATKKDRITHRIAVTSAADIDGELKRWLKEAYDRD